jgi:hypothetical protein
MQKFEHQFAARLAIGGVPLDTQRRAEELEARPSESRVGTSSEWVAKDSATKR